MESPSARILQLETRIADLKARLPRHSIPPAMLLELEDLEEELVRLLDQMENQSSVPGDDSA